MKKTLIAILGGLATFSLALSFASIDNKTIASAESAEGVTFSNTVYKISNDESKMLLVTAISNYSMVYEIGYDISGYTVSENDTAETRKYYESLTTGGVTETAEDIFGPQYADYKLLVWEVAYTGDVTFQPYALEGVMVDGNLTIPSEEQKTVGTARNNNKYTVTFEATDGTQLEQVEYFNGQPIQAPNVKGKDGGYTVWTDAEGNTVDFTKARATSDMTITETYSAAKIVENSATEYAIALSANASAREETAANFLKEKIKESTGVELAIKKGNVDYSENAKYISIGDTSILSGSQYVMPNDLGASGYVIDAQGMSLIIAGESDLGTLYGVYEFANMALGYEYYAHNVSTIESKSEITLGDINVKDIPSFESRMICYNALMYDYLGNGSRSNVDQLRLNYPVIDGSFSGMAHTTEEFISRAKYPVDTYPSYWAKASNPESYTLCYSNSEVREILLEGLKTKLAENPEVEEEYLFVLGGSDTDDPCTCNTCKNHKPSYNAIACANYLAEELQNYFDAQGISRRVVISISAYKKTAELPGNITLYGGDDVKVGVVWTPIYLNYGAPITDSVNSAYKAQLDGWAALCAANNTLTVYDYCVNWAYSYANFDNFRSLQANLQYYNEKGVSYVFAQGLTWMMGRTPSAGFYEWRNYLQSKLMWDVNSDVEALKESFFNVYYDAAADSMLNYYDELVALYANNYATYSELQASDTSAVGQRLNLYQAKYFPQETLELWLGYIDDAYASIAGLKNSDPTQYDKLYNRICLESVSVRYLMVKLYGYNTFTPEERMALKNDIERFGC